MSIERLSLAVPGYVHSVAAPRGGSIVLDGRSGRCYTMNGTAHELWQEWRRAGDFETALAAMADRNSDHAGIRFRSDAEALAKLLLTKGLLVSTRSDVDIRRSTATSPVRRVDTARPSFRYSALFAVPLALLLIRLPFRVTARLLSLLRSYGSRRGATGAQAVAALLAAEAVTRYHPGRVACLELSLAAVIAMALRRRQLSLVIGVADDPCRFHAWVATQDGPVGYPMAADIADFRPIAVM